LILVSKAWVTLLGFPLTTKLKWQVFHMGNFFACLRFQQTATFWHVATRHRSVSICHLANIAMKIGGSLKWVPKG